MQLLAYVCGLAYSYLMRDPRFAYIVLQHDSKAPVGKWRDRTYSAEELDAAQRVGVRGGEYVEGKGFLTIVDVDVKNNAPGLESWDSLVGDRDCSTYMVQTPSYGFHYYFYTQAQIGCPASLPGIDIKGLGGYVCAPPTEEYLYMGGDVEWAPAWLEEWLVSLGTAQTGSRERRSLDALTEDKQVEITREMLEGFCICNTGKFRDQVQSLLDGVPVAGPGQRHQILRLGMIPQLVGQFGAITLDSMLELFRGDYPAGYEYTQDEIGRYEDALTSARRKVDPTEPELHEQARAFSQSITAQVKERVDGSDAEPESPSQLSWFVSALGLSADKQGRIKPAEANIRKIIEKYYAPKIRVNIRRGETETCFTGEWTVDGDPESYLVVRLQDVWGIDTSSNLIATIIKTVELRNTYDPVLEYLGGLSWDGVERVRGFFARVAGAEDVELTREHARCFFVGAAARTLRPGCKFDTQLILKGPQGIGKSSLFQALCADSRWFSDTGQSTGESGKDFLEKLHRVWLWEHSEIVRTNKDESQWKAFLSTQEDSFRSAYARRAQTLPRRFAVCGSTNDAVFLADTTGTRRFHVVECKAPKFDLDYVRDNRDQLWAEAVHMLKSGVSWWLDDNAANTAANADYERTPLAEIEADVIADILDRKRPVAREGAEPIGDEVSHDQQHEGVLMVITRAQLRNLVPALRGKELTAAIDVFLARKTWKLFSKCTLPGGRVIQKGLRRVC